MDNIYEYCGVQRTGKTTLMVADIMNKVLNPAIMSYVPSEVYCNYYLDIDGVNVVDNEKMLWVLTKARLEGWQHKVFSVDECSQPPLFYARNTRDKVQTDLVTSIWQMPKKFCIMQYSSNIGNSVDVQQRDATATVIMPLRYNRNEKRELETIDYRVMNQYERWFYDERYKYPAETQKYFDSFKPVK